MPVYVRDAPLGCSASWLGDRSGKAEAVCRMARNLDLGYVKLGPCLHADPAGPASVVYARERIQVAAVQNVYAVDADVDEDPEGDLLSDPRPVQAERAFARAKKTAAAAKTLGTNRVILHLGVLHDPRLEDFLRVLDKTGTLENEVSQELRDRIRKGMELVSEVQEPWLDRAIRVLHRLLKEEPEITFCLENRLYFHQLPGFEALTYIFEDLKSPRLAYWHNTGFAQVQESLGGTEAGLWLDRYAYRLAGVHLQDACGLETHLPPGAGSVDFKGVRQALPMEVPRIMDLKPETTPEEFRIAIQELKLLGF